MHSSKKSEETMKSDFLPADEGVYPVQRDLSYNWNR